MLLSGGTALIELSAWLNRLTTAKQPYRNNNLSSAQTRGLTRLMNFESGQSKLAKLDYAYVADPENYY